ncbi:MAG: heme-binding domain-containing protein [Taibaiella sp.]|nr:heme-binding domain-containing protein [Taibaiella sp.]
MFKKILLALLIVFVIIQLIRPAENISSAAMPRAITAVYPVSDSVQTILKKACYDCHSDNTRYPWYVNIQPVAWWMNDHVMQGRSHLNFSQFGTYKKTKQARKLGQVAKSVTEGWMPIGSYTWIHKDAILSKNESAAVATWANGLAAQIGKDTLSK